MAFCLAGALSFNLASSESADNRPVFAQLMLDEAFSKSDPQCDQQDLGVHPRCARRCARRQNGCRLGCDVVVAPTISRVVVAVVAAVVAVRKKAR